MKYLVIREAGGTQGSSSKGRNFGECTAKNKQYVKDGVTWTQKRVYGSGLIWGYEYTSLTKEEIISLADNKKLKITENMFVPVSCVPSLDSLISNFAIMPNKIIKSIDGYKLNLDYAKTYFKTLKPRSWIKKK